MKPRAALLLAACAALPAQQPGAWTWFLTNDSLYQKNDLAKREVPAGEIPPLAGEKKPDQFQESLAFFGTYRFEAGGDLALGATLRGVNFYKQDPNATLRSPETSLYRWSAKYRREGWSVQAGDFHALLGQGFVLSVLQNDTLLRERTIRGAEARWQGSWLDLRALGGSVSTEVRSEGKMQKWDVTAAEAVVEVLRGHRLGVRASQVKDAEAPLFVPLVGRRLTDSFSLSGAEVLPGLSYYGEYGRLLYRDERDRQLRRPAGNAAYGNLTYRSQGLLLLAEHKKYENFDNGMNNLPLADREEEVNDLLHSEGTRLFAQYHVARPDLTFFGSAGRYVEGPYIPGRGRRAGTSVYGGFSAEDLWDAVSASYSYGLRFVGYAVKKSMANLTTRFQQDWSLELSFRDKRSSQFGTSFHEQDLNTQLAKASWGALWVLRQHSRDPIELLGGGRNFYSAGVRANLRNGAYVELSGGRLRGGEVCSGGQCVTLPPFKGFKVAAHFQLR
ncbi:MAG: hypothetical protein HY823_11980 [Acidobacteria bacterium]|nr:hypothetical protein [Acidobacteriota bacterium]